MAFQSVEMRNLTEKLDLQTEKYLEITHDYEAKKMRLIEALKMDDIGKLQNYDFLQFREILALKRKAYHDVQVTREEIKLRGLFDKAQSIPQGTSEYYNVYIEYWEQKLQVIRVKNGEFSYNRYKPVANYQIGRAKEKLARCTA